ncbi:MAG: hypothetical protein M1835_002094 [Candelina submexicana]|nr:MAG: hypothetical protein M1835_002094 [Candelina submexicana]
MSAEVGVSDVAVLVGNTTFCTGFAIAPMVLAPFSETIGRKPVFIVTGILLVGSSCNLRLWDLTVSAFYQCASSTMPLLVLFRDTSRPLSSRDDVVSGIYHAEDRNMAMALFSGAALMGFLPTNINGGLRILAVILFSRETHGSVLLSKKAKVWNNCYQAREDAEFLGLDMPVATDAEKNQGQRIRWKVLSDEE